MVYPTEMLYFRKYQNDNLIQKVESVIYQKIVIKKCVNKIHHPLCNEFMNCFDLAYPYSFK